jgi:hypothetical protein
LNPLAAGLWTIPSFAAFIVGAFITPLLVRRVPSRYLAGAGLAVAAVGFGVIREKTSSLDQGKPDTSAASDRVQ